MVGKLQSCWTGDKDPAGEQIVKYEDDLMLVSQTPFGDIESRGALNLWSGPCAICVAGWG